MKRPEEIVKKYLINRGPSDGKYIEFTIPSLQMFVDEVQRDCAGMLSSEDVRERLCALCSRVAEIRFKNIEAADCFCGKDGHPRGGSFRFSHDVLEFVENEIGTALTHFQNLTREIIKNPKA